MRSLIRRRIMVSTVFLRAVEPHLEPRRERHGIGKMVEDTTSDNRRRM